MANRMKRILAGAVGGMVGGVAMTATLMAARRMAQNVPALKAAFPNADRVDSGMMGRQMIRTAALGGVYGAVRSALNLPGLLAGPLYGLATYGMERAGLGAAMSETEGPWNQESMGMVPRMMTSAVYGMVAGWVAGWLQDLL